ncbi:MAG: hypothetical protein KF760_17855 [Candidatus Eremiobacteraeota bacterium]|nr:hypothetical protein [Candidatus Eremiobacteraeota bacterium]MCW5869246.1 hypothetical protein [Candidatus Eremiobacteraeota bacterium]
MAATTDVTIAFLAKRDASFDKTNKEVRDSLETLKKSQSVAAATGDTAPLKLAQAEVARLAAQFARAKREAAELAAQVSKLRVPPLQIPRLPAPAPAPTENSTGSRGHSPSSGVPAASRGLYRLEDRIQDVSSANDNSRAAAFAKVNVELSRWARNNQQLLRDSPQLQASYTRLGQVASAGLRQIAGSAGQQLAQIRQQIAASGQLGTPALQAQGFNQALQSLGQFKKENASILAQSKGLQAAFAQTGQAAQQGLKGAIQPAQIALSQFKAELAGVLRAPAGAQISGFAEIAAKLQMWKASNADLINQVPLLKSVTAGLTESAVKGLQGVISSTQQVGNILQNLSLGFAGISAVFGGAAAGVLTVASSFQQLEQKLASVTRSAAAARDKLDFATSFAAKTPFDVQGAVDATAILEGFQQKSEDLLPVAANLAAALGKSLPEATIVLAKAASGSTEGFEQLRNSYAVTTRDLLDFGAVQGEVAGTLSHAGKDIEANRNALIKLVNVRFGDAIARQSATLAGALSNTGDEASSLANKFGSTLLPMATLVTRGFGLLLGAANAIPAPIKAIAAAGLVATAGATALASVILGVGAAALGSLAGLALLQSQLAVTVAELKALEIEAPLASAALSTLNVGVSKAGAAFGSLNVGMAAGIAGNLAFASGVGAIAAVVGTVALSAISDLEKGYVELGDRIRDSSHEFADANRFFRQGVNILNDAGKQVGVTVQIVGSARQQMAQINAAFASLSNDQVVDAFAKAGIGAKQLDDELKKLGVSSNNAKERLRTLAEARNELNRDIPLLSIENKRGSPERFRTVQSQLQENSGIQIADKDDLDAQIASAQKFVATLLQAQTVAQKGKQAYEEIDKPLEKAATSSALLSKFLDLSRQVGTTQALSVAMESVNKQIEENSKKSKIGTDNLDQLITRLANPALRETERAGIEAQIQLIQQRNALVKSQADLEAEAAKKVVDAQDLAFRRRKALGETNLHDELYFTQQRLKAAKEGTDEEVSLLERAAALREQIQSKLSEQASASLRKQLDASRQLVQDAQAGTGSLSVSAALEKAQKDTEKWASANKSLLKQFPELQAELDRFNSSNAIERQREHSKVLKDNLEGIIQPIQTAISESTTGEQKLSAVSNGILAIQRARKAGLLDEAAAQSQLNSLSSQKIALEKQITAEKQRQKLDSIKDNVQINVADSVGSQAQLSAVVAGIDQVNRARDAGDISAEQAKSTLNDLTRQQLGLEKQIAQEKAQAQIQIAGQEAGLLDQELQILQIRKDAGEDVEGQITAAREQALTKRLSIIDQELQAAIDAGQDEVNAAKQASLKKQALMNQETIAEAQELQKRKNNANRIGGSRSPILSGEEAFADLASLDFSLDMTKAPVRKRPTLFPRLNSQPTRLPKTEVPETRLSQIRNDARRNFTPPQQLSDQINQAERAKKEALQEGASRGAQGTRGQQGQGGRQTINYNATVNGTQISASDSRFRDAVITVIKRAHGEAKFKYGV